MKKKLIIIMNVIGTSVLLHGMDIQESKKDTKIDLKNLKRTDTGKGNASREISDNDRPDVTLNLGTITEPLSLSQGKPSIKKLNQVTHLKKTQNTYRDGTTGRGSSNDGQVERKHDINENEIDDNNNIRNSQKDDNNVINDEDGGLIVRNDSRTKRRSALGNLTQEKTYSAEEMWDLLKTLSPKLYEHAQENKFSLIDAMKYAESFNGIDSKVHNALKVLANKRSLSLDQQMEYAHLLENFNIDPEVLVELLQQNHGFGDDIAKMLMSKFEDIKKKDPDNYLNLALDFITRTCSEGGLKEPSPLHKAQVSVQSDTIVDQNRQLRYQYAALIVGALVTLGGYAWGIFGQVYNPTSPTNAPTMNPTFIPTYSPTGSPT